MNKPNGFTLVELLVIIAVVFALLALFIMGWQAYKQAVVESHRLPSCMTNLRAVDQACVLYADAHDEKYPVGRDRDGRVTVQDSFRIMLNEDVLPLQTLICPSVGGAPAQDEWELVGVGGLFDGDPAAAAEAFIHYGYQDIDAARAKKYQQREGENYLPGPKMDGDLPVFADRGQRADPQHGDYTLTGKGGANHPMNPSCQLWVGGAHGVQKALSEEVSVPGDNIYEDQPGVDDCYLLSSEANAGGLRLPGPSEPRP